MHKREFLYILSKLDKVFTQQQSLPVLAWVMSVWDGSLVDSLSPSVGARVRDSLCSPAPASSPYSKVCFWLQGREALKKREICHGLIRPQQQVCFQT